MTRNHLTHGARLCGPPRRGKHRFIKVVMGLLLALFLSGCEEDGETVHTDTWMGSNEGAYLALDLESGGVAELTRQSVTTAGTYRQEGDHLYADFPTTGGSMHLDLIVSEDTMSGTMADANGRAQHITLTRLVFDIDAPMSPVAGMPAHM